MVSDWLLSQGHLPSHRPSTGGPSQIMVVSRTIRLTSIVNMAWRGGKL